MKIQDIKVGGIYQIKPGKEIMFKWFLASMGKFIRVTDLRTDGKIDSCDILDENMKKVGECDCFSAYHLVPINDIHYPYVGMKVTRKYSESEYTVSGVCGKTIFLSDYLGKHHLTLTTSELEEDYCIREDDKEEIEEMTLKQVCEELGRTVKIIKE